MKTNTHEDQKREEIKIDRQRKKIKTDPTTANQRKGKKESGNERKDEDGHP